MLYISERVLDETQYEIRRRIPLMVSRGRLTEEDGQILLAQAMHLIETKIAIVAESSYSHLETEARNRIPRDPDDWHTVALALEMDAAIWTQDCDFLGLWMSDLDDRNFTNSIEKSGIIIADCRFEIADLI